MKSYAKPVLKKEKMKTGQSVSVARSSEIEKDIGLLTTMPPISIDHEILKKAIHQYGYKTQMLVAVGESGEFGNAIVRNLLYEEEEGLIDELADILIVAEQVRMMLNKNDWVQQRIDYKLKRLYDNIPKG